MGDPMDLWVWVATWDQEDLWDPMVRWEWGQMGQWEDTWAQMDLWVVQWAQMDRWEVQWGQMVPITDPMDLDMVLMVPCQWGPWVDQ